MALFVSNVDSISPSRETLPQVVTVYLKQRLHLPRILSLFILDSDSIFVLDKNPVIDNVSFLLRQYVSFLLRQ